MVIMMFEEWEILGRIYEVSCPCWWFWRAIVSFPFPELLRRVKKFYVCILIQQLVWYHSGKSQVLSSLWVQVLSNLKVWKWTKKNYSNYATIMLKLKVGRSAIQSLSVKLIVIQNLTRGSLCPYRLKYR